MYRSRSPSGKILCAPCVTPSNHADEDIAKRLAIGPFDYIHPVNWLAFGMVAIHRSVFEAIQKTAKDIEPRKDGVWRYFSSFAGDGPEGEDTAFSKRAVEPAFSPTSIARYSSAMSETTPTCHNQFECGEPCCLAINS